MVIDMEGYWPFFTVYYNPKSLMNIIAFCDTRKRFRITMDTDKEVAILVHIGEDRIMRSVEIGAGLYIWKPEHNSNLINKRVSSYSFLNLVSKSKSNFTRREIRRIDEVKSLYINMGVSGYKKFYRALETNYLRESR